MPRHMRSLALISRLPLHGTFLYKLLSSHYDVVWIGKTFPFRITLFNSLYILFSEFWKLFLAFRKKRFPLILVQYVSLDAIVAIMVKLLFGVKVVLFAIGSDVLKIREHIFVYPIMRFIFEKSDFVFCASSLIEERLKEMNLASLRTKIVPSIVDISDFKPYHGPKIYDVITVGALDPNKNHMLLIKACELLPSVKVLIIGDGPLREVLLSESAKRKAHVVFLGNIPHKQVFTELQKSRIYVHTSKSEGLPVSVLEAIFCGLPIILVKSPYVYDIRYRYKFYVHIVKENSAEHLARTIKVLLENYELERSNAMTNRKKIIKLIENAKLSIKKTLDYLCL